MKTDVTHCARALCCGHAMPRDDLTHESAHSTPTMPGSSACQRMLPGRNTLRDMGRSTTGLVTPSSAACSSASRNRGPGENSSAGSLLRPTLLAPARVAIRGRIRSHFPRGFSSREYSRNVDHDFEFPFPGPIGNSHACRPGLD